MGGEVEVCRDSGLQRECIDGGEEADHRRSRPQRERLVLEDEPACPRTDEPAELPGETGERHVAAEQLWLREVDDERRVDRAVQALP